jgi:hypothetical protein
MYSKEAKEKLNRWCVKRIDLYGKMKQFRDQGHLGTYLKLS